MQTENEVAAPTADTRPSTLDALAEHSRYVQRVRRRHEHRLALLPPGLPDAPCIDALIDALLAQGQLLPAALRTARALVIERLAVLDLEQGATLDDVTHTMTALAERTLERALAQAEREADARFGVPRTPTGERIGFWIVGMGKLGARELNVSSDIDLIYVYEEDGHTDGSRPSSAHEYFCALVKGLYALIGDTTEDGFVFRVDLALRPNGMSGPPVVSLAMLEEYFQVQGREWERFAWLKSRVVAPRAAVHNGQALALRALVTPFVYRKYLDYSVFEGLRQLHQKIRAEAQRRSAGRPERAKDVKLSRGGIREIEFIVQMLLVARGGQFPEIRTRSTLKGLQRLVARGLMKPATAQRLAEAYVLLRRIEHRIQYLDDQQTHQLPAADADLAWIARSLGLTCKAEACELLERFDEIREFVANEFDLLLHEGSAPSPVRAGACKSCGIGPLAIDDEMLLDQMPAELAQRVQTWARSTRVAALREESKLRLGRLMQRANAAIGDGECDVQAALRFVDWIEPLFKRESYLALLVERPEVQRRLLRLLGLARWPMRYLMQHPGVIDELADARVPHLRFDAAALSTELQERHAAWERSGEASEEALLDTLRRAHHAEVFRTLVRDVEGQLSVEQVADELSALADAVLEQTLRWAWALHRGRHRELPQLAVIAYGKLGGKELGYGSDLDLVFLYDDAGEPEPERAQEVYGSFVRKLITWLTLRTAAGELFDIDTALRPNGNSGLLVTSIAAFERYQSGRGGNTAWTWEHQALTRARFCAGAPGLKARFDAVRESVLTSPRDAQALRAEVRGMRDKLRAARPVPSGRFDVKHSPGGMVDVEFAVQALVLGHAREHPELLANAGNIALLHRAQEAGLLQPGTGHAAADAYRQLRQAQHRARLDEQPTQVDAAGFASQAAAVHAVWRQVLGD
jgi:[glutamine synthetase] adenylyltransferase / [glutamine synthetase]-adenylyl-L-tyrosine phosphorylase